MSIFSVEYNPSVAVDVLRDIRQKVAAIREPIYEAVHGPIHDAVVEVVHDRIAPPPREAVHPFDFATLPSRNWYFWMKRTGQIPGQDWDPEGGSWDRTDRLESSWTVSENTSANDTFLTIENDAVDWKGDNYAQAVYGPEAVPGHEATGWGEDFDAVQDDIANLVEDMLLNALDEALGAFQS